MSAKRDLTDEEVQKMIDHGFDGEERLRNELYMISVVFHN